MLSAVLTLLKLFTWRCLFRFAVGNFLHACMKFNTNANIFVALSVCPYFCPSLCIFVSLSVCPSAVGSLSIYGRSQLVQSAGPVEAINKTEISKTDLQPRPPAVRGEGRPTMSYPDYELPYAKKVLNKERVSSNKMSLLKAGKTIVKQAYLPFPLSPAHSFSLFLSAGNLLTMPILVEYTK